MKIYKNRDQIIKDIDRAKAKIAKAKQQAQEHLDAEELLTGTTNLTELRKEREAADKMFRKIKRLETVRLPKLGEKLAEMDTMELGVGNDGTQRPGSPDGSLATETRKPGSLK